MEFNFDIEQALKIKVGDGIYYLDGHSDDKFSQRDFSNISHLLDVIGERSAVVSLYIK